MGLKPSDATCKDPSFRNTSGNSDGSSHEIYESDEGHEGGHGGYESNESHESHESNEGHARHEVEKRRSDNIWRIQLRGRDDRIEIEAGQGSHGSYGDSCGDAIEEVR